MKVTQGEKPVAKSESALEKSALQEESEIAS